MQILESVDAFRQARRALPANASLGLVPTMGVRYCSHWNHLVRAALF
jgi:pantothenate synthetase